MMKFSRTFVSAALMAALCTASCSALAAPDAGAAATASATAASTAVPTFNLDADVNRALKTFGVPGMAIAIVKDGKPWGDAIRDRILAPLGMDGTTTSVAAMLASADYAAPHSKVNDLSLIHI